MLVKLFKAVYIKQELHSISLRKIPVYFGEVYD